MLAELNGNVAMLAERASASLPEEAIDQEFSKTLPNIEPKHAEAEEGPF